tara:strand:- start:1310 stop:1750 length:441 start_codon:yes stop_codon:yes gene_type:complete
MIIKCPNCNKKFQIDQNLIPSNGRMLQCGSCDHNWFFKFENENKVEKEEIQIDENVRDSQEKTSFEEEIIENENDNTNNKENKLKENNLNYFKIILVVIISFVAFIIILDTFKNSLISIFPNIKIILDNLYQSLHDINLFMLDLFK